MHEWADLDWRRRIFVGFYLLFARELAFSSPTVQAQFAASPLGRLRRGAVLVVPANMKRPREPVQTSWSERVAVERAAGKLALGHFGSIYPKKHCDFVLDVAAALKRRGRPVFVVFVGSFIKGSDNVEADFWQKARRLSLTEDVMVTGYVETDSEIFGIFDAVDVFAYRFAEGLTSRRSSILACLQSGRPIVVNAPDDAREFDHHPGFVEAIDAGALRFVPRHAGLNDYVEAIEAAAEDRREPLAIYEESWRAATLSLATALGGAIQAAAEDMVASARSG